MDGQFTEVPSSLNLTYGETAMFVCRHQSADHISWEVTPRWRYDQFEPTTVGGMYVLSVLLRDGINYNATIIQCKALFDDHLTQSTEPAILLVQGMCIHTQCFMIKSSWMWSGCTCTYMYMYNILGTSTQCRVLMHKSFGHIIAIDPQSGYTTLY